MNGALLLLITLIAFILAYRFYGGFVARKVGQSDDRPTPAHTMKDGVDYVPTRTPVVLGHHFASIAGAGPIIGPILAVTFGWLPAFLWILIGTIFIGAVHDYHSLVASIRHGGKSIGEVIEAHIGDAGKRLFLTFSWFALILVVAVFTNAVAATFASTPTAATSSLLFIVLAIVFGLGVHRARIPLALASVFGVLLMFLCVWLGTQFPLVLSAATWKWILLGYVYVAAIAPVWVLLQPRDYLNSFLLYAIMGGAFLGVFVARPHLEMPKVTSMNTELGFIFPILFVTVACGAISGFHSLVASGTTAKQLNRESDAKPVGYGSMLIEGVLAVIALMAAAKLGAAQYREFIFPEGGAADPIGLFAAGVGSFLSSLGVPLQAGTTFAALAVAAFAMTSLDTCVRLARFAFQEFFERKGVPRERQNVLARNRFIGTFVAVAAGAGLALSGGANSIWPIFGAANQLLAALALLAISVWLSQLNIKNGYIRLPMYFMFAVTLSALGILIWKNLLAANWALGILATMLFAVALILAALAYRSLKYGREKEWSDAEAERPA